MYSLVPLPKRTKPGVSGLTPGRPGVKAVPFLFAAVICGAAVSLIQKTLFASVVRKLGDVWPVAMAAAVHLPALHVAPAKAHEWPHAPQLAGSLVRLTHELPQIVWPDVLQLGTQLPELQFETAPVTVVVHLVPQPPQLLLSDSSL